MYLIDIYINHCSSRPTLKTAARCRELFATTKLDNRTTVLALSLFFASTQLEIATTLAQNRYF